MEFQEIAPRLDRIYEIAARIPTYLSAVIPRTPLQPSDEDADDSTTGRHRGRQFQLSGELIRAAARGAVRYVLIGQDDTWPGSPSQHEREALQSLATTVGASNVLLSSGADELNARLLARWLNDLTGVAPSVQVLYTYPEAIEQVPRYEATPLRQTVSEHVHSAGCQVGAEDASILLWVHNFSGQQREAQDQPDALDSGRIDAVLHTIVQAVPQERVVALADVGFANGADRALMRRLLDEPRLAGVVAYAGWNTCSNSLGAAIAQAVVVHHLRAVTLPGNDRIYRPALFRRILDDWGYQAVVRPQLTRWLDHRGGDAAQPEVEEPALEALALERLRTDALPALQRSFRYHPTTLHRAAFPWHRLFEIHLELEVANASRQSRSIVVVEHDPRWAQSYEQDKTAILRTLGPRVRGIEHVGSTAVPGLVAKPIIDILLGVEVDDLDTIIEPLVAIGYEYNPDWEISMPLRRYFRRFTPDGLHGSHHLHAVPYGSEFWTRHIRFRDYLRAHPRKAGEYGALKKQLAQQHQSSIEYTFAKTEFIRSVESLTRTIRRRARPRTP